MFTDADLHITSREPTGLEMLRYIRTYQDKMRHAHMTWLANKAPSQVYALYPPPWLPEWREYRQREFDLHLKYFIDLLEEMENVGRKVS